MTIYNSFSYHLIIKSYSTIYTKICTKYTPTFSFSVSLSLAVSLPLARSLFLLLFLCIWLEMANPAPIQAVQHRMAVTIVQHPFPEGDNKNIMKQESPTNVAFVNVGSAGTNEISMLNTANKPLKGKPTLYPLLPSPDGDYTRIPVHAFRNPVQAQHNWDRLMARIGGSPTLHNSIERCCHGKYTDQEKAVLYQYDLLKVAANTELIEEIIADLEPNRIPMALWNVLSPMFDCRMQKLAGRDIFRRNLKSFKRIMLGFLAKTAMSKTSIEALLWMRIVEGDKWRENNSGNRMGLTVIFPQNGVAVQWSQWTKITRSLSMQYMYMNCLLYTSPSPRDA